MSFKITQTITCDRCGTTYDEGAWKGVTIVAGSSLATIGGALGDLCSPCIHGTQPGQPPMNFPPGFLAVLTAVSV